VVQVTSAVVQVTSAVVEVSETNLWGAAPAASQAAIGINPFRLTAASSSPRHCDRTGLDSLATAPLTTLSPSTAPAVLETVAPPSAALTELASPLLWPTRDSVDDIEQLLVAIQEDADVQVERPTTPSSVKDDDGASSVW
jgi:hypothetical protein